MKIFKIAISILSIISIGFLTHCKNTQKNNEPDSKLVIYCENGILASVREFSSEFEKETGIRISIQNDCARNLSNLIHYRGEADIFIPDCRLAIDNMSMTNPELFEDTIPIGYQTLIYLVSRGNPLNFNGDFATLTSTNLGIILANPETSSLGQATEILLKKHSVYNDVVKSVLSLTTDSRGLLRNISSGQSQVAIDWASDYLSSDVMELKTDTLHIPSDTVFFQVLAAILKDAPNKQNALKYIDRLKTHSGKKFFRKYGITELPSSPI
ncbi:substrate-binding domain-containing protein [Thermophagus sp. OGC60D27]|uniref:substrate-binding domain-containing protein n=1 Tax=Thermophagus sp. OGC60D27 TaxID=3458415 RepID=UPI0040384324